MAREYAQEAEHEYSDKLKRVQTIIIDLTSAISRYGAKTKSPIPNNYTKELEDWIQEYSKQLPPPEQYIIPVSINRFALRIMSFYRRDLGVMIICDFGKNYFSTLRPICVKHNNSGSLYNHALC